MNKPIIRYVDIISAVFLVAIFALLLILLGTRTGLSFDVSYNLLSYQNLFYGKGFIYDYDGVSLPFDPGISTGPELYLPAFLIWKVLGFFSYDTTVYVLVGYYVVFLCFLLFYVCKDLHIKTVITALFIILFLSNRKLFEHIGFAPLGEYVVCFFVFAGIYLLSRKKILWSGLLLGLALDLKTNYVVGLLPALLIMFLREFVIPVLRKHSEKEVLLVVSNSALLFVLVMAPYLVQTRIVPFMALEPQKYSELRVAQRERSSELKMLGFGHIMDLKKNPNNEGIRRFTAKLSEKASAVRSWFVLPFLPALLLVLLIALLIVSYRAGHYAFYLFVYSAFIGIWWFFGPVSVWYRYLYPAEWALALGIVAMVPSFLEKNKVSLLVGAMTAIFFLSQFSYSVIRNNLDDTGKQGMIHLAQDIRGIDDRNLFAYGWFQSPQIMLLSNKRFRNYTNRQALSQAKSEGRDLYLVTTNETLIPSKEEIEQVLASCELIKAYYYHRLYKIIY